MKPHPEALSAPSLNSTDLDVGKIAHWIFDMDGTLTHAVHDFEAIRRELGLKPGEMILEAMAKLPAPEAQAMDARLFEIELELARQSTMQEGADELLASLKSAGASLGILTRNSEKLAEITLDACGLLEFFQPEDIIGREHCAPKPKPDGVLILLEKWKAPLHSSVIVGDFRFDLEAGRAAGIQTIYFDNEDSNTWNSYADLRVTTLSQLTKQLEFSHDC